MQGWGHVASEELNAVNVATILNQAEPPVGSVLKHEAATAMQSYVCRFYGFKR